MAMVDPTGGLTAQVGWLGVRIGGCLVQSRACLGDLMP